jgi:uncharacterized protein (DUF1499 family)
MFPKTLRRLLVGLLGVGLLIVIALGIGNAMSKRPARLGLSDGRLSDCPDKPNCVNSQAGDARHAIEPLPLKTSAAAALEILQALMQQQDRAKIVVAGDNYLHVEFRSPLFRFVDDVEFVIDEPQGLIHFRSASRVGYSDLGANRKRMEKIRLEFQQRQAAFSSP